MSSRVFLQPFACVGVLFILHRLSAFVVISHNTATYFELTGTYYNPLFVSISYGVVRLISSLCMPLILIIMTKRTGFISFGSASTLAMLGGIFSSFFGHWLSQAYPTQSHTVAVHAHLINSIIPNPEWLKNLSWLPLLATCVVAFCHSALLSTLMILQNEVFSTEIRYKCLSLFITVSIWYCDYLWNRPKIIVTSRYELIVIIQSDTVFYIPWQYPIFVTGYLIPTVYQIDVSYMNISFSFKEYRSRSCRGSCNGSICPHTKNLPHSGWMHNLPRDLLCLCHHSITPHSLGHVDS